MTRSAVLLLVALLLSCGQQPGTDPSRGGAGQQSREAPHFPVRLLPRAEQRARPPLVQDFALDPSLQGWWWAAPDAADLSGTPGGAGLTLLEHTTAQVEQGALIPPPGPGWLLRTLSLPVGQAWVARVETGLGDPASLAGLALVELGLDGADGDGDHDAGDAEHGAAASLDAPTEAQLRVALSRLPLGGAAGPLSDNPGGRSSEVIHPPADDPIGSALPVTDPLAGDPAAPAHVEMREDRLVAERLLGESEQLRRALLVVPVGASGRRLLRVRVGPVATPVAGNALSIQELSGEAGEPLAQVLLSGDLRLALRLLSGQAWERVVDVPPGATALTLGVASLGEQGPSRAGWRVEWRAPDGWRTLGEEAPVRAPSGPPRFLERRLPWPGPVLSGGELRLRFSATGRGRIALAEPMLRGPPPRGRRNLLLISLDTLRADHLGLYGYARDTSPFLDSFSKECATFEQQHSVSSYTLPTHASLLTGLHPLHHGATRIYHRLASERLPYLPRLLAEQGWATAAFTGGAYVSDDYGFGTGFDRFDSSDPVEQDAAAAPGATPGLDRVGDWIEARADEAWFLFLHTYQVHDYAPPEELLARFDRHPDAPWSGELAEHLLRDWRLPENAPTPADVGALGDAYDASIAFADREMERLLGRLSELGLEQRTIVVITSDHGEEFWEHGSLSHGLTLYEEQLHVPWLLRLPGVAGRRIPQASSLLDVAPTLLDALGLPPLPVADGRSWLPFLTGRGELPRPRPQLAHLDVALSNRRALLDGPFKLHWGDVRPSRPAPAPAPWQLFDLASDPGEQHDLSEERPVALAELRRSMERLQAALSATGHAAEQAEPSPEVLAQLRELGYLR